MTTPLPTDRRTSARLAAGHPWRRRRDRARRGSIAGRRRRAIRAALDRALEAGSAILARGGSALDAVEAAVRVLEDDPHFNAGRGSVFTYEGRIEMDASIMDGAQPQCRRGHRRHRDPQPDQPRPPGDGAQPARLPQPRGRRPILARAGPASRSRPNISRRPSAAASSRSCARGPSAEHFDVAPEIRHGRRGRARPGRAMSPPRPRPAASPASAGAGSAIRRSSAPAPMPTTAPARSRRPAPANISSASASPTKSARGSGWRGETRAGRRRRRADRPRSRATWAAAGGRDRRHARGDGVYSFNTPGMYRGEASPAGRSVAIYGDEASARRSLGTIYGADDRAMISACSASPSLVLLLPAPGLGLVGIWP